MNDPTLGGDAQWTACNYSQLLQRQWDDEIFVFNPASGQTHILNSITLMLLQYLADKTASFAQMQAHFLPDADPQTQQQFQAQLEQLVLIGLICRPAN